jgi:hypothetical protein
MSGDPIINEWSLLKDQFDALVRDEDVSDGSIAKVLDAHFHRRLGELINRVAERNSRTATTPSRGRFVRIASVGVEPLHTPMATIRR